MKSYDLPELLDNAQSLTGTTVTVSGVIFTHWNPDRDEDAGQFDDFYVVADKDSWEEKARALFLRHEGLEDLLRRNGVSGRAGGINGGGLSNSCRVTGLLRKTGSGPFPLELTDLQSIEVWLERFRERTRKVSLDLT